ncbi:60S ribosomal protein L13 [Metschnikowia bicuspidata]|uniref:60S ribosomal protein L13 n=1 Tax=Metschnikowia bicuspidata TaxID=27322 RepID=A0A4P9ZGG2_9ASCO|nr:60S ribosomal protein L13 [Metschnikowia bicuspidata]
MAISKNVPLLKNHFRKNWQERVKVHFNQAVQKTSRRQTRQIKAVHLAPRPVDALRPIVRCPTIKYNRKVRAGRGFTVPELKAAGLSAKYARTIGIAVDLRRQNNSEEGFDANVIRLKEYLSKLIVFSKNKPVADAKQVSVATTFPIVQTPPETAPRAVFVPEKTAVKTLKAAWNEKKYKGINDKKAREAAEAEAEKKKK